MSKIEIVKCRPIIHIPKALRASSQQLSEALVIDVISQWAVPHVGERPAEETADYWVAVLGFFASQVLPCFEKERRKSGRRRKAFADSPLSPEDGEWLVQQMDLLLQEQQRKGEPLDFEKAAKQLKRLPSSRLSVTKRAATTLAGLYHPERRRRYRKGSIIDHGLYADLLMKKRRKRRRKKKVEHGA